MLSLCAAASCSAANKALHYPSSLNFLSQNPKSFSRVSKSITPSSLPAGVLSFSGDSQEDLASRSGNYAGVKLDDTVAIQSGKLRLDSWISSRISGISRARVQSSIRSGLVSVNGRVIDKVSHAVRAGDQVSCIISELQPLKAEAEDIPLDIVYEDEHIIVVNKPAHMVVHPAPGNATGTLVNGILHHCSLPTIAYSREELSDTDDISDDELNGFLEDQTSSNVGTRSNTFVASVRPGIVHRLDKGTSGLLVVAKNEQSHAQLSEQFKLHTIHRVYISLTCGVPSPFTNRIDVPIGRDLNNRIRMAAVPGPSKSGHIRNAASRYRVIEVLAGGASALVEWRLETGRTHQIRAHAKYVGIPLLGDEVYGGTKNMAMSLLRPRTSPSYHVQLSQLVSEIERPCLHALALGFRHPHTGENIQFSCPPPTDFAEILGQLRKIRTEKVSYPAQTKQATSRA